MLLSDGKQIDYNTLSRTILNRGRYVPVPQAWMNTLGIAKATLLSHLLMVSKSNAEQGWVQYSPAFVRNGIGMDAEKAEERLDWLEEQGYIEQKHRNGRRYVHVVPSKVLGIK